MKKSLGAGRLRLGLELLQRGVGCLLGLERSFFLPGVPLLLCSAEQGLGSGVRVSRLGLGARIRG